jgi:tRNA nucleotidyltransferase (CCA-adding enzyme)
MKVYMVGGAVRDKVMGIEPKDIDYVVVGATPADMIEMGYQQVGAGFPVFLHPITGDEYALARTERKTGVGYNGFETVFDPSITLEDDLIRRDLTINAMAMDLDTGEIIDPYGGRRDIQRRDLRHTSEAFAEDPIRVLRTARFAARYDFMIAVDTVRLMRKVVPEIDHVPAERVFAEFQKGLMEDHPYRMIHALQDCDADCSARIAPYMRGAMKQLLVEVDPTTPIHVRFALMMSTFTDRDYEDCKIPTELARVSKAVHYNFEQWLNFDVRNPLQVLDLFDKVRAYSNPVLLEQVLDVMEMYMKRVRYQTEWRNRVIDAFNRANSIDAAAIAESCADPKHIRFAIREARCAALR